MRLFFKAGWVLVLSCMVALSGCVDRYMPEVISTSKNYLVVDGFINSSGITSVVLSRTYAVDSKAAPLQETKANVYVEEEGGTRYRLSEDAAKGTYISASLQLNTAKKHRLHILTAAGQEYASDFVAIQNTPSIDSVSWQETSTGVSFYTSTHDPTNAAQYYRWEYEETWEFSTLPDLTPTIEWYNGKLQPIRVKYPDVCWSSAKSTTINLGNTAGLSKAIISNHPVHAISRNSNRIYLKYSILVKQHALSTEEYAYWELLKKNTEQIGTLFDPLPAQITGNIRCLNDADEVALGYVGAHSLQEKRIFIRNAELAQPRAWQFFSGYEGCYPPDTVAGLIPIRVLFGAGTGEFIPIHDRGSSNGVISTATYSRPDCVDCRKRGTAVRPSFWQ